MGVSVRGSVRHVQRAHLGLHFSALPDIRRDASTSSSDYQGDRIRVFIHQTRPKPLQSTVNLLWTVKTHDCYQPTGQWASRHQMSLNGKRDGFVLADFKSCADAVSMKGGRAEAIIEEVRHAVGRWRDYADDARVRPEHRDRIQATLRLTPLE